MFDVISRIPGDTRVASQKAGTPSSASSALYDQILRSVLLSMESPANSMLPLPAPAAADEAPVQGIRTLEDVMMQRQFVCSVHDTDSALTLDQLALQPQSLTTLDESEQGKTNELLTESLNPWELLLGRLTLQQRLAV
ncbi:hypothetical protein K5Q02_23730 [Pseudomonas sp. MM211]|uniref:hypothetical protein n=1 Tax=Pseudomonas sp. MM211 TaxID=2866808 RepID=UPI001CECBA5D|nr:hypothetical protein [Pseudomonas sp. MM211]UCJ16744.1 hypothetical protein K5Q02_23730 [Pseudomonas sp. MM211]